MALTAHQRRGLIGGAKATTLAGDISNSATTVTVTAGGLSSWAGANSNGTSTATFNRGHSDEETFSFTGISGDSLTGCTRGEAGTTGQSHSAGATIELTTSKIDADEANELVAAMANNSCRVYNNANISVTDSAFQALTFNSERFDTGGLHSTSANTGRITIVTAGKYLIDAGVEFPANATGERILAVRLNGTTYLKVSSTLPTGTNPTRLSVSTVYSLAVNDFLTVEVFQSSGGFLNVNAAGNYSPEFGCALIGL